MTTPTKLAFNTKEAAAATGLSEDTIKRAIRSGALKASKSSINADGDPTGRFVILAAELQAWLEGLEAA